jgi:hypothetical protein
METAVTEDRIYVATQAGSADLPVTITALDRASGREVWRQSVGVGDNVISGARLFAPPDGKKLYMLFLTENSKGTGGWLYTSLRLPGGEVEKRLKPRTPGGEESPPPFLLSDIRIAPDGHTFYYFPIETRMIHSPLALRFFDLEAGKFGPSLEIAFEDNTTYPVQQSISHDGSRLYVLSPTTREMAIIDLKNRSLKEIVKLDTEKSGTWSLGRIFDAIGELLMRPAQAKQALGSMQLSPDGRYLYASGVKKNGAINGIWVIDTGSWRVTDHLLRGVPHGDLLLGNGGRPLYTLGYGEGSQLRTIDLKKGEIVRRDKAPGSTPFTLSELYRKTYGKSPGS